MNYNRVSADNWPLTASKERATPRMQLLDMYIWKAVSVTGSG